MYQCLYNLDKTNDNRKKALSNETLALTESMNMDIWVVSTLNQLL